jgi:two-component system, OmpR family, response regulator ResD
MDETILIVEDRRSHLRFVRDVLCSEGYTVLEAGNSEQAKEILLKSAIIHLLIMDQMVPGLTGTEFLKHIQIDEEFRKIRNLPVIILTAYPEDDEVRALQKKGIPVLSKPLRDYHDLLDAVKNALK